MSVDDRIPAFVAGRTRGVLAASPEDATVDRRLVVRFTPEHTYGRLRG